MLNVLLVEDDIDLAATWCNTWAGKIRCDHASNGVSGLQLMRSNSYDSLLPAGYQSAQTGRPRCLSAATRRWR